MPDENLNANAHKTGEYTIIMGEHRLVLKRTMGALKAFNNAYGGLTCFNEFGQLDTSRPSVAERVHKRDLTTCCFVIRTGLELGPGALPWLDQAVFDFGVEQIASDLQSYLWMCRNATGTPIPGVTPPEEVADGGERPLQEETDPAL